jgi:ADP-heptose:LPS heptosyltransferase
MQRKAIYRFFDRYLGIPILLILSILFKRKRRLPVENIRNILIIKFAAVGDVLLMQPLLRALKKAYPNSKLTFLSSDINYSMVKRMRYIDEIINYNIHYAVLKPINFLKFLKNIRKNNYELLIDAEQWSRINAILTVLLKKRFSIGFKFEKQFKHFYYDAIADYSKDKHIVENFLSLLEPIGIYADENEKAIEFYLSDEVLEFADKFWEKHNLEGKYVVCMQPGSGTSGFAREWDDKNYAELGRRLVADYDNVQILLTGLKSDFERCDFIVKNIGRDAINISGKFNMDKDLAIIKKANLMICGNTGILHLTASVKTKTIGLHGPNNPILWGAYDKNAVVVQSDIFCSPCLFLGHEFGCKHPVCMDRILVEDVYRKVVESINSDSLTGVRI